MGWKIKYKNKYSKTAPLLFISFFIGMRGNCPAEWADDKIRALQELGRPILIITGLGSNIEGKKNINVVKVPSISWNDFNQEIKELKDAGLPLPKYFVFMYIFSFIFGKIIDLLITSVTKHISSGRWSWVIFATPIAIYCKYRFKIKEVFTTGGPSAAHVVGLSLAFFTRVRLVTELQDPIINRLADDKSKTHKYSLKLEFLLAKYCSKLVFVTKEAAKNSQARNPNFKHKIKSVYPSSWKFNLKSQKKERSKNFEFLHLGTLYGSRNLDAFLMALDELKNEGFSMAERLKIVNLGAVYCENSDDYDRHPNFSSMAALERTDALKRAQNADILILAQHSDERSKETIPYKTYDYLNLKKPIFGILNNDELSKLITMSGGFVSKSNDKDNIKFCLKKCLYYLNGQGPDQKNHFENFDIITQFSQVLD